jgi:DNA repair photolyase
MGLVCLFDPWKGGLCSCGEKFGFGGYVGCGFGCVYCYASGYVRDFSRVRVKKNVVERLRREVSGGKLKELVVSVSNSSDPYPFVEEQLCVTRECLKLLAESGCSLQLVTKNDLVLRDVDVLRRFARTMVCVTITTDDDVLARRLEPFAPGLSRRLRCVERLVDLGFAVSVRVDPVIPFVNEDGCERLMERLAEFGVQHVTSSTYKVKPDNWRRFARAFPDVAEKLKPLYFERGVRIGAYWYLPRALRLKMLARLRGCADHFGLKFGVCREGLSELNSARCDGSWMIRDR